MPQVIPHLFANSGTVDCRQPKVWTVAYGRLPDAHGRFIGGKPGPCGIYLYFYHWVVFIGKSLREVR